MPNEKFMRLAIAEARKNFDTVAGGPFGACIVKGGRVLAVSRNTVLKNDATSHAEINAIRLASKKIKSFDLSGCAVYSTAEPCPMCFSAIHWARIDVIIYGASIKDAKKTGFNELSISNKRLKALGKSKIEIIPGFLADDCVKLLRDWDKFGAKKLYYCIVKLILDSLSCPDALIGHPDTPISGFPLKDCGNDNWWKLILQCSSRLSDKFYTVRARPLAESRTMDMPACRLASRPA
ncbi:MAG: nucleoside deaminase, partial [Candidatus Omnitrophota bacterium]